MADPESEDPIARESTRLAAVAPIKRRLAPREAVRLAALEARVDVAHELARRQRVAGRAGADVERLRVLAERQVDGLLGRSALAEATGKRAGAES